MKTLFKVALLPSLIMLLVAAAPASAGDEEQAILKVIEKSYVKGIHEKFDEAAIMSGFHPAFILFTRRESNVMHMPLADWVGRIKESADPNAAPRDARFKPIAVNVTIDAASACMELHRDGKHIFTDFFLLFKLDGEWKIVGKISHRH